jgi:chromosome segregation ATPase
MPSKIHVLRASRRSFLSTVAIMEVLKMEAPMTDWNNDRLDELNGRVKEGFADVDKRFEQVDERFVRLEGEMKEGFAKVDQRFVRLEGDMKAGFDKLNERFDRLYYLILVTVVGLIGSLLANNVWG